MQRQSLVQSLPSIPANRGCLDFEVGASAYSAPFTHLNANGLLPFLVRVVSHVTAEMPAVRLCCPWTEAS